MSKNSAERSISFPSLRPAESPFPPYRPSSRGWANTSATVQRGSRWIEERKRKRERVETGGGVEGVHRRFLGVEAQEATWRIDRVALASRPTPLSGHPVYACACACVYVHVYVHVYVCTSRYVATDRHALYIQSASHKTIQLYVLKNIREMKRVRKIN